MKMVLLIFATVVALGVIAYIVYFPRNTFISFNKPGGGAVTFSRGGVSFEAAPHHYATNGFEQIESYVARLLAPANRFKSLSIFTPDGNRGFGFSARDGVVQASLTMDWRREAQREAAIRAFFGSLGVAPSRDYLAGNGGIADATRFLSYRITGNAPEVTALTKRILQELCSVSPSEALDIDYEDK